MKEKRKGCEANKESSLIKVQNMSWKWNLSERFYLLPWLYGKQIRLTLLFRGSVLQKLLRDVNTIDLKGDKQVLDPKLYEDDKQVKEMLFQVSHDIKVFSVSYVNPKSACGCDRKKLLPVVER